MFERFTEQARKAVVLAQEEARRLGHNYIGTEHLLLGLLRQDQGAAARALSSVGVTLNETCEQIESMVGRGEEGTPEQSPFTPRSKRVLDFSLREALQLGHSYVDTGHVLLGLVSDPDSVAMHALSRLGVDPDEVHRKVAGMVGGRRVERRPAAHIEDSRYARATLDSLVRAWVEGLLVHARRGVTDEERALPQTLRVDLEYAYRAGEGDELEDGTVDYGAVLRGVAGLLEREEFKLLETGTRMAGRHVLERFTKIWEVAVRVTKLNVPGARTVSGVSVEAEFRW